MTRESLSRDTLLPRLSAHVLEHGLGSLSLRPLAKAAGTSDRMLLYHFGSKEALVEALLAHIAGVYTQALAAAWPQQPATSRKACAQQLHAIARAPMFAPFLRLWWEIVAGAARGDQAYLASAGTMMNSQLAWFAAHLPPDDPDPAAGAQLVTALVEGALMLDALGLHAQADAALCAI